MLVFIVSYYNLQQIYVTLGKKTLFVCRIDVWRPSHMLCMAELNDSISLLWPRLFILQLSITAPSYKLVNKN